MQATNQENIDTEKGEQCHNKMYSLLMVTWKSHFRKKTHKRISFSQKGKKSGRRHLLTYFNHGKLVTSLPSLDLKETGIAICHWTKYQKATSQLVTVSYLPRIQVNGEHDHSHFLRGETPLSLILIFWVYSFWISPLLDLCSIIHKPSENLNHTSTVHLDQ